MTEKFDTSKMEKLIADISAMSHPILHNDEAYVGWYNKVKELAAVLYLEADLKLIDFEFSAETIRKSAPAFDKKDFIEEEKEAMPTELASSQEADPIGLKEDYEEHRPEEVIAEEISPIEVATEIIKEEVKPEVKVQNSMDPISTPPIAEVKEVGKKIEEQLGNAKEVNLEISLTRKFEYINQLFGGNAAEYKAFADKVKFAGTLGNALEIWNGEHGMRAWNKKSETSEDLKNVIRKAYNG